MKERKSKRYSTAFKRKVVREVETGELTIQQARRLPCDIGGGSTVEVASEHFGVDVKKNFGTPPSSERSAGERGSL